MTNLHSVTPAAVAVGDKLFCHPVRIAKIGPSTCSLLVYKLISSPVPVDFVMMELKADKLH